MPRGVRGGAQDLRGEMVGCEWAQSGGTQLLSSLAGEPVSVVGFGAFGQACGPSVTSGILSAVVHVDDTPVMLQTTCAVHGGSSGGPLFSTRSGDLLGN